MSPTSGPPPPPASPLATASSPSSDNCNPPPLPPLITSTSPAIKRSPPARPSSQLSKSQLSHISLDSVPTRSRPLSHVSHMYLSSLSYTIVRDFAYPTNHPMHAGPPPQPSRPVSYLDTPMAETARRASDPSISSTESGWDDHGTWPHDGYGVARDYPPFEFSDGPPWSEDEDLQSPVVSSRHRKHKSAGLGGHSRSRSGPEATTTSRVGGAGGIGGGSTPSALLSPQNFDAERGYYVGTSGDGSERYYVTHGNEPDGPGSEFVAYPPEQACRRHPTSSYLGHTPPDGSPPLNTTATSYPCGSEQSSMASSPGPYSRDESRYSRDYQFTITSPDEEMHGKAVALFDFERENENELPLVEGQIIWVSYRHGQGWLVAEDPKTHESGLVPEEYVRLLRHIEGGIHSLSTIGGSLGGSSMEVNEDGATTAADGTTPTNTNYASSMPGSTTLPGQNHAHSGSGGTATTTNGYHQPVVSTFSTSSKDLDPYPPHLLGPSSGQPPPQVVHYHGQRGGSQANTPTMPTHRDLGPTSGGGGASIGKDGQQETRDKPGLDRLPDTRLESANRPRAKE